jgi:hypothetical protein
MGVPAEIPLTVPRKALLRGPSELVKTSDLTRDSSVTPAQRDQATTLRRLGADSRESARILNEQALKGLSASDEITSLTQVLFTPCQCAGTL